MRIKFKSLKIRVPSRKEVWQYNLSLLDEQLLLVLVYNAEMNVFGRLIEKICPKLIDKLRYKFIENPPSRACAGAIRSMFSAAVYSPFTDDVEARQLYDVLRELGIRFEYVNRRMVKKNFKRMVEEEMDNVERVAGERFVEPPSVRLVKAEEFHDRAFQYEPTCKGSSLYISPYGTCYTSWFDKEILIPDRVVIVDRPVSDEMRTRTETMRKITSQTKFNLPRRYYNWEKHKLLNSLFEELFHALHYQKRGEWGRETAIGTTKRGMVFNIPESLAQIAKEKGLKQSEPERRLDVFTHALEFWVSKHSFSTYRAILALAERYPLTKIGMLDWVEYSEIYNPLVTWLLTGGGPKIRVGVSREPKYRVEMVKDIIG